MHSILFQNAPLWKFIWWQAGDELPRSPAGILVAVADRLDSLVGLCAAGCTPSASADPFGLRRRWAPLHTHRVCALKAPISRRVGRVMYGRVGQSRVLV